MEEELLAKKVENEKLKTFLKVKPIEKMEGFSFVKKYHYLGDALFFSQYTYGVFFENELVGVAAFAQPQGAYTITGWFGNQFKGKEEQVMELQRLAVLPMLNGTNVTSFLLGNAMKLLKKENVKVVITLADATRHVGSIYQVTNFKYYGLTARKTNFYVEETGKKVGHGKTKGIKGVYIPRSQKHRYAFKLDKNVEVLYKEEPKPTVDKTINKSIEGVYVDKRLGEETFYYYHQDTDTIERINPTTLD